MIRNFETEFAKVTTNENGFTFDFAFNELNALVNFLNFLEDNSNSLTYGVEGYSRFVSVKCNDLETYNKVTYWGIFDTDWMKKN